MQYSFFLFSIYDAFGYFLAGAAGVFELGHYVSYGVVVNAAPTGNFLLVGVMHRMLVNYVESLVVSDILVVLFAIIIFFLLRLLYYFLSFPINIFVLHDTLLLFNGKYY